MLAIVVNRSLKSAPCHNFSIALWRCLWVVRRLPTGLHEGSKTSASCKSKMIATDKSSVISVSLPATSSGSIIEIYTQN